MDARSSKDDETTEKPNWLASEEETLTYSACQTEIKTLGSALRYV